MIANTLSVVFRPFDLRNDQELASLVAYHRKQLQVSAGGNFLLWWNGLSQLGKTFVGLGAFYLVLFLILGVVIAFAE